MSDIQFQNVSDHKKSEVWKHFLYDKAQQRAQCKLRSVTLKAAGSSTKSLISHLKSKHKIQVKRRYEIAAEDEQPILKVSRIEFYFESKKESISEVIARLVSVAGLTFNQIAKSSLNSRAFKADGNSMPKSPQTIRDHFVKEYKNTLITVSEKVNTAKKNEDCFSISFDESTSVRNRRYMNLNGRLLKGIHSRPDTNRTGPRVYPFITPGDCCTAWIRCWQ